MINPETNKSTHQEVGIIPFPFSVTQQFLTAAINAGVLETLLQSAPTEQRRRKLEKSFDTATRYIQTEATLPDIAEADAVSVNEAFRRRNFGSRTIWGNSPPIMQQFFPFERLTLKKPLTEGTKRKISRAHNGKTELIEHALLEGKPLDLIIREYDLSTNDLVRARRVLNSWGGVDVPHNYQGYDGLDLASQIESIGKLSPRHKQELLDSQTLSGLNKSQYFAKLKEVVEKAGYKFSNATAALFAQELQSSEIPIRTTSYVIKKDGPKKGQVHRNRFILRADVNRAAWVLKYNPKFAKYKRKDAD